MSLGLSFSSFVFVFFKLFPFQPGINNCSQNDIFHSMTILLDAVSCWYGWPGTELGIKCVAYYLMLSAVCMGGLGTKFRIKCMAYNRVGIYCVLCEFYERKKERKKKCFLYWKCGILWKSKMQRHVTVQLWLIASGPRNVGLFAIQPPDMAASPRIFY